LKNLKKKKTEKKKETRWRWGWGGKKRGVGGGERSSLLPTCFFLSRFSPIEKPRAG
jgi:hypothetical protein